MESDWMAQGSCNEHPPEVFFPNDGVGVLRAQRICNACPVQADCLAYALSERIDHGVWGGASERSRRRMLKKARAAATLA